MTRYLLLGDPVVAFGPQTLIPDGTLIIDGPEITAAGPREVLAARGPFDRVLGSPARRWAELGALVEPYLPPLYQRWYDVPVDPAHVYNARRVSGAD